MNRVKTNKDTLWYQNETGHYIIPAGTPCEQYDLKKDRIPYKPWKHFSKQLKRKGEGKYSLVVLRGRWRLLEIEDLEPME